MLKEIKHIIAAAAALVLFICSLPVYASQSEISDNSGAAVLYEKLHSLGIQRADSLYGADKVLRRDFIALAAEITNESVSGDVPFRDISSSDSDFGDFCTAYKLGYIQGDSDGNLYPDREITYKEAAVIMLRVLEYSIVSRLSGNGGYLTVAERIKLTKNIALGYNDTLTGNYAMQLAVNTLEMSPLEIAEIENGNALFSKSEKTFLESRFNVKKGDGFLERNEFTDLYTPNIYCADASVMISGKNYRCGNVDCTRLIGTNVEFYVNTENETLLFAAPQNKKNEISEISSYDISGISSKLITLKGNRKIRLSDTAKLIKNGKAESLSAQSLMVDCGDYILIDNDRDGLIDVVNLNEYTIIFADAVSSVGFSVAGDDTGSIRLDKNEHNTSVIIKKDGADALFDDIKPLDIILYAQSAATGKVLKQAYICRKSIAGTISGKDEYGIDIDGKYYSAPKSFLQVIETGAVGTVYFDKNGGAVAFKRSSRKVYGYLKEMGQKGLGKTECRIFTENNRWVTLPLAKKIKYNYSVSKSTAAEVMQNLGSTPQQRRQLIEYEVDSGGSITAINTAQVFNKMSPEEENAIENNIFRMTGEGEMSYLSNGNLLGDDIAVKSGTVFFSVPNAANGDNEDDYAVISISSLIADETYNVKIYNADKTRVADVCVIYDIPSVIGTEAEMFIVKSFGEVIVSGEPYPSIKGYMNGEEISFPVKNAEVISSVANGIKKYDIIRMAFDKGGLVSSISKTYNSADGAEQKFISGTFGKKSAIVAGKVISCDYTLGKCLIQYSNNAYALVTLKSGAGGVNLFDKNGDDLVVPAANAEIMKDDYVICTTRYSRVNELIILRNQ